MDPGGFGVRRSEGSGGDWEDTGSVEGGQSGPSATAKSGDLKSAEEVGRMPEIAKEGEAAGSAVQFGDLKEAEEIGGMLEVLKEGRAAASEFEYMEVAEEIIEMNDAREERRVRTAEEVTRDTKAAEEIRRMPEVSKDERGIPKAAAGVGHPKAAKKRGRFPLNRLPISSRDTRKGRTLSRLPSSLGIFHTSEATNRPVQRPSGSLGTRSWPSSEEKEHHDDPPLPQQPMSSSASADPGKANKFFSRIEWATDLLLVLISSPLRSSSDAGCIQEYHKKRLKGIKLLLCNVEIEVMRDDSIYLLLKELKDLTTEVEDVVDLYLYRLFQTQVENPNSAAEASPVGMQMDEDKEEKLAIQSLIPYDMSERIKMIKDKFFHASLNWKPREKPSNYVSFATLKKSKELELLRTQVLEEATIAKSSLKMKGVEKDEAGDVPVVSSAKKGSFNKYVQISGSTSRGIILNKDEEIKDKMSKDWEADCHSEEDRKRLLADCVSDLPPNIQIYGRDVDKENIINLLLSDARSNLLPYEHGQSTNKFFVIPIIGMAGVGKTTLAKLVYNDPAVCEYFDARGWVHVSKDTTDVSLSKAITSSVTGKSYYGKELNHLQTILHEELIGKRLLLVLDDVQSHNSFPWKSMLALLSGVIRCKIIVTSQNEQNDIRVYESTPYYLGYMPLDKSWDLFRQCAFYGLNPEPQDELVEIGMRILCKFNNLPLDVKILGSLLNFRFDKKIWTDVLESEIWETETLPALILSYNLLPSHLKPCFLYCSMFPKGYKFDKYELVRLWMAQDYIILKDNKRLEDLGCEYFCELQRLSFFDKSWDGTFTMHDLLYELAKSISRQEFCAIEDSNAWDIDDGVCHLYVAGGYQRKNSLSIVKPLALRTLLYQISDGRIPKILLTSSSMKHLQTLELKCHEDFTVQETTHQTDLEEDFTLSSLYYGELIHLRYLRICDKYIESLSASVCKLYHLQTLILDNCSNLKELPSEIGNLFNLRYLGLSKVNIKMLPKSVCQLLNLQYLIVDYCGNLCKLPMHIGNIRLLHHLGLSGTNITRLPESICHLSKVKILKLNNCTNFVELPSDIGDLANLQEIEVNGARIARLPDSVCSLFNLLKLDLARSDLLELPNAIGNLLKLNYLGLSHTKIDMLPESLCWLPDLHTLKLNSCTNLSRLPSGIGALTSLHHLILSDTDIAELPESLCQLSNLQTLELDGCRRYHSLPSDIGDLINLVHLKLSDTDISELPTSFCKLSNMKTLELNCCYRLSQLPHNIGNLSNLYELEITETVIRKLPKSLCQLGRLRKLKLNDNKKLEEFPGGIENLSNLTHLELCEVGIMELPEHIGKLTKLVKLSFESKYKPNVGFSMHKHAH